MKRLALAALTALSLLGPAYAAVIPAPAVITHPELFGTGADGNVTISSGTTTLTRDMHYANLTITGTGSIRTAGYRIYVSGTLDISAAPNSAIWTASPTISSAVTVPGVFGTSTGGAGSTTNGGASANASGNYYMMAAAGATGGSGGAGGSGAAGAAGTAGSAGFLVNWPGANGPPLQLTGNMNGVLQVVSAGQSSGGGGGGGDTTNAGSVGGISGAPGGTVVLFANVINRGPSTAAGAISAKAGSVGANGSVPSTGNAGGGGGGGGGSGGCIWILAGSLTGSTATNALDVSGTAGGNGGNGVGTGKGGNGGNGGNAGSYQVSILSPASFTANTPNQTGTAGSTTATATGASGGAGATAQGNL